MTAPNARQQVLVTPIPRGFAGTDLRVGVRLTPRLSYDVLPGKPAAVLGDFPDFSPWPQGGLSWSASFDNGATWVDAKKVIWKADQGFWAAMLHADLRVDSKPIERVAPVRAVTGYPMRALANALQTYHVNNKVIASPLGQALRPFAYPNVVLPATSAAAAELAAPVQKFMEFHRQKTPQTEETYTPIERGALDPDFHQRIALLADHGPVLERLGLALELTFAARSTPITKIMVRAVQDSPATNRAVVFTSAVMGVKHQPGSVFAAATSSPLLDDRLRLKLNDTNLFDVHSIDVDASVIGAFALPRFTDADDAPLPPPPQTTGFTIALDNSAGILNDRLATARQNKIDLGLGQKPVLAAESLIQGYTLEVRRKDVTTPVWRSLCHRRVTYTAIAADGSERTFVADSEAPVVTGLRMKESSNALETSDLLFRWDGWSLGVERPGKYQLQEDASTGEVVDSPGAFPGGTLGIVPAIPPQAERKLPVLRFGSKYEFRARAVDVTGFAHPWDAATGVVSPEKTYLRYDPVAAPIVLGLPKASRTETTLRLVVRSDPATGQGAGPPTSRMIVPARGSVETALTHGMFDKDGAPDPGRWAQIADLDEKVPPQTWPLLPTDDPAGPPIKIDWLPDPMSTRIGLALLPRATPDPGPLRLISFLPGGAEELGSTSLGSWQPVEIVLKGGSTTSTPSLQAITQPTGKRVQPVSLPPGHQRFLEVRAIPAVARFKEHGLAQWIPEADRTAKILNTGYDQMCPPVRIQLVHAVRKPLTEPALVGAITITRGTSQKDPTIQAMIQYDGLSTGRITLVANWEHWRDAGPTDPSRSVVKPGKLKVTHNVVAEDETSAEVPVPGRPSRLVNGTLVAPDKRRIDVTFRAVETSRYVEEFREEYDPPTWNYLSEVKAPVLNLPVGWDVESVRLLRDGRDLVRVRDYRVIIDPRWVAENPENPRRTVALPAGSTMEDRLGITVLVVKGTVLSSKVVAEKVVVKAAMRPLPPEVEYAVPAFTGSTSTIDSRGYSVATRGAPRVRIWLERPWWSSGVEEKLAVVWQMNPAPPQLDVDTDRVSKIVSLFGQDPLFQKTEDKLRMTEPTSGVAHPFTIFPEENIPLVPGVRVRLHDVAYDDDRDLYYADVEFPTHRGNKFVRLAVARFQEHVTSGNSQLSRIRTIDPIRLMPHRRVEARNTRGGMSISVTGPVELTGTAATRSKVRVSLQRRAFLGGGSELGWDTVTAEDVFVDSAGKYAAVGLPRYISGGPYRILVEEYEVWPALNEAGLPPSGGAYQTVPDTEEEATADLRGLRPVWVTTLDLPTNTP